MSSPSAKSLSWREPTAVNGTSTSRAAPKMATRSHVAEFNDPVSHTMTSWALLMSARDSMNVTAACMKAAVPIPTKINPVPPRPRASAVISRATNSAPTTAASACFP